MFAAIKLSAPKRALNAPHPIKLVFAATDAVYPLRLTAIGRGNTEIELFVVGNATATCPVLAEEFCDHFALEWGSQSQDYRIGESFHGTATPCSIGHPAICPLLWNGCVLTKLSGTVRAGEMKEDIRIDWKPFHAYRQHFYSVQGARAVAWIVFLVLAGGLGFASMLTQRKKIVEPGGLSWYLGRVLLPRAVLSAIVAGIVLASLPKVPAAEVQVFRHRDYYGSLLQSEIASLLNDHPKLLRGTSREIADAILKQLGDTIMFQGNPTNLVTGSKLKIDDTPGNFTVEKQGEEIVVRVYGHDGTVYSSEYPLWPAAGAGQ